MPKHITNNKDVDLERPGRVIVVDDEKGLRDFLEYMLLKAGYEVFATDDGHEALAQAKASNWDLVIQDVKMPKMDGLELLRELKNLPDAPLVLVITAHGNQDDAVTAMRLGATTYISKPFEDNDLVRDLVRQSIFQRRQLEGRDSSTVGQLAKIVGTTPAMRELIQLIRRVAPTDSTILITGESGTGKELVARAIHDNSLRANGPFIPVNCGAFSETLLESELFGHLKGAFTGAVADKRGLLDIANGGTFFLDEVAEMTPSTQVKLLRVLENREFKPVGGVDVKRTDARFITATNQDMDLAVNDGRFREDLYYRLNVIPLTLPALRERKEDIHLLAGHFINRYSSRIKRSALKITEEAIAVLEDYKWPGNVRELENTIERAITLAENDTINPDDLGPRVMRELTVSPTVNNPNFKDGEKIDLELYLSKIERGLIEKALLATNDNLTTAAELLGIPFRSMRYRAKKLGIKR